MCTTKKRLDTKMFFAPLRLCLGLGSPKRFAAHVAAVAMFVSWVWRDLFFWCAYACTFLCFLVLLFAWSVCLSVLC